MGSLGHRALLQYIDSNDLPGLKTFLDTRHLPVDDRDEVISCTYKTFRLRYEDLSLLTLYNRMELPYL